MPFLRTHFAAERTTLMVAVVGLSHAPGRSVDRRVCGVLTGHRPYIPFPDKTRDVVSLQTDCWPHLKQGL